MPVLYKYECTEYLTGMSRTLKLLALRVGPYRRKYQTFSLQ